MLSEKNDYNRDVHPLHDKCKRYINYHTILTMTDGSTLDGIIESVDMDHIVVLIGEDVMEAEDENQYDQQRQFQSFGRPRRRFRRFRRRRFPFNALAALSLLRYPHFNPPYHYYPYPPY